MVSKDSSGDPKFPKPGYYNVRQYTITALQMLILTAWYFRKRCEFAAILRYISQKVQASAIVTIESWIRSRMRYIEWSYFQWLWVTANPVLKVTVLFKGEHLKNSALRQSCYRLLIGNYRQAIKRFQFRWPWMNPDAGFKVMVLCGYIYFKRSILYCATADNSFA